MQTNPVKFYKTVVNLPNPLEPNTMYAVRVGTGFDFYISDLTGSIAYKINPSESFSTLTVEGQTPLVATGVNTLELKAGPGILIETDNTSNPKSVTFTSTGGAGESTSPIKTFNILNAFSAPLLGKAVFIPAYPDIIRSVILTNGTRVGTDLMVGLYRNTDLLSFFTLPAGNFTFKYTSLNFVINNNDYLTVNVVSGFGENFSLALYNFVV